MNRKIIGASLVAVALLAGHVVANPLLAASQVRDALRAGDGDALADRIDFPALQEDLSNNIEAAIATIPNEMDRAFTRDILAGLVQGVVREDVVRSADPRMLQDLTTLSRGSLLPPIAGQPAKPIELAELQDPSFGFGLTRFTATLDTTQGPVTVVFAPSGVRWKIVGVDVDVNALMQSQM